LGKDYVISRRSVYIDEPYFQKLNICVCTVNNCLEAEMIYWNIK